MALPALERDLWNEPISRRTLLSRGLMVVGGSGLILGTGLTAGIYIAQTKDRASSIEVDSEYGRIVEERFGIRLTAEPGITWDDKKVLIVGEVLSHLPPYTYAPRGDTLLTLRLTTAPPDQEITCCSGSYDLRTAVPSLRGQDVREDFMLLVSETVVHELTHYKSYSLDRLPQKIVEETIGEDFKVFSADLRSKMSLEVAKLPDNSAEDSSIQHITRRLNYGLANVDEFVAVLSEIYIGGKDYFNKMSRWVNEATAKDFYDIIKSQIFDGREYKSHAEIEGKIKFDWKGRPLKVGFLGIDKTKK